MFEQRLHSTKSKICYKRIGFRRRIENELKSCLCDVHSFSIKFNQEVEIYTNWPHKYVDGYVFRCLWRHSVFTLNGAYLWTFIYDDLLAPKSIPISNCSNFSTYLFICTISPSWLPFNKREHKTKWKAIHVVSWVVSRYAGQEKLLK